MAEKHDLSSQGEAHRQRMARRSREKTAAASEVGELPPVVDAARRESCHGNLLLFLETYFPASTGLSPLSNDHRNVIERIQTCILNGGRFTNVVYRGFAKTTIASNAAIWATIYGHRKFVPIFSATATESAKIVDSIRTELESNPLLLEDFPAVCFPIQKVARKTNADKSQTHNGKSTYLTLSKSVLVLPSIEGSLASGAIVSSHGMTAASRGMFYTRRDGTHARPDFVIIDDPQTDESARSPLQCNTRLDLIRKCILKGGGHQSSLACVLNGTIIESDDIVDQLSDPSRNPSWQSVRIPMIRAWSNRHEDLWLTEYARIRNTYDNESPHDQRRAQREASEFYAANREAMDAGCIVSWQSCYDQETEISAIQHAYNILIDDGADVFASECQNQPRTKEALAGIPEIRAKDVAERFNGVPRGIVPLGATHLVAHIDVQHSLLYWSVFACNEAMTGSIVDHNSFPEQNSAFFALRDAKRKLSHAYPGTLPQAAVEQGLKDLIDHLFSRTFKREDGAPQALELVLVDWSDGTMAEVIGRVCRNSTHKANLMPAAGVGIGPGDKPMSERKKPGDHPGRHWIIGTNKNSVLRSVRVDTNYWKSRAADALTCPPTNPGAVTLFGDKSADHRMIADHYASEQRDRLTSDKTQATVDVWTLKPNRENHYFDNLVGCLVAASMKGCGVTDKKPPKRRRTLEEMASEARR